MSPGTALGAIGLRRLSPLWDRVGCGPASGLSGGHLLTTVRQISASRDITALTAWEWPGGGERHVSRVPHPCRAKVPSYHLLRPKAACGRRSVRGLHVPLHQAWEPAAPTRPLQTCGCTSARPCTRHAGHPRTLTAGHPRGLPLCPESSAWLHASPSTTTLREAP